jgi:DNA/RNA endonuclease YhcR with UshA esterase domain
MHGLNMGSYIKNGGLVDSYPGHYHIKLQEIQNILTRKSEPEKHD